VISHHGKFWSFDNLRLTPRPIQQPSPPRWVTVVSTSSARKAARRGAKLCTGFHPQSKVIEIFDAYRDEASKIGRPTSPDDLCIRRQVTLISDDSARSEVNARRSASYRQRLRADPRLDLPERPALLDTPTAHAFSIGDDEFITGTPEGVAEQIIAQCREAGAGHFSAVFDRSVGPARLKEWYRDFGAVTIPKLRSATVPEVAIPSAA
jgi:alkanesulfonate monooxygenase SsuD/methylene tetrahydromethanopterin reductase-like flavin-dependent oxidoreductase (luciferase family)